VGCWDKAKSSRAARSIDFGRLSSYRRASLQRGHKAALLVLSLYFAFKASNPSVKPAVWT
jgi:hypothetical protein